MSDSFDPMDCSMPGFPVLHYLPEIVQTHVHWVSDADYCSMFCKNQDYLATNMSVYSNIAMKNIILNI